MKNRLTAVLLLAAVLLGAALLPILNVEAAPQESRTVNRLIVNYGPESVTATGTQTVTPTRSLLLLNNAATLTLTVGTGVEGDVLIVISEVTTNTIFQTTNTTLASAQTISQNDVLRFTYANSQWVNEIDLNNAAD